MLLSTSCAGLFRISRLSASSDRPSTHPGTYSPTTCDPSLANFSPARYAPNEKLPDAGRHERHVAGGNEHKLVARTAKRRVDATEQTGGLMIISGYWHREGIQARIVPGDEDLAGDFPHTLDAARNHASPVLRQVWRARRRRSVPLRCRPVLALRRFVVEDVCGTSSGRGVAHSSYTTSTDIVASHRRS